MLLLVSYKMKLLCHSFKFDKTHEIPHSKACHNNTEREKINVATKVMTPGQDVMDNLNQEILQKQSSMSGAMSVGSEQGPKEDRN